MQKLHLVGTTTDQKGLIFSARRGARSGGYVVTLSDDILEAIEEARAQEPLDDGDRRPVRRNKRPESTLTVREMQSRLRVGRSIEDVAAEAGVDPAWVEKFAPPVWAEQAQVVNEARSMFFEKRGKGRSAEPLGDAVRRNVASRNVAMSSDEWEEAWTTHLLSDGLWLIRFRYRSRGHVQDARWEYDQVIGRLVPRDRLASQLSYVQESRRRLAPVNGTRPARTSSTMRRPARPAENGEHAEPTRPRRKRKAVRKKAAPRKTTARKTTARKTTARKTTARKTTARKTTGRKTTGRKATTKRKAPAKRKTTARKAPARKATGKKATRRPVRRSRSSR